MGTQVEDFLLAPNRTIQDSVNGIESWRSYSEEGKKYSINVQPTYIVLRRSWYPSGSYCLLCFAPFLFGIICFLMSKKKFSITLSYSEGEPVGVHAVLDGDIREKMEDYYELKGNI